MFVVRAAIVCSFYVFFSISPHLTLTCLLTFKQLKAVFNL